MQMTIISKKEGEGIEMRKKQNLYGLSNQRPQWKAYDLVS